MRLGVLALVALTLLMVPTSTFAMPSPFRQLAPPQSYDWMPRTSPSAKGAPLTMPNLVWSYSTGGCVISTPAVADLFGDGRLEVVVGSWDHNVYCLDGTTGNRLWNHTTGNLVQTRPAIADVDGDGQREVLIGSEDGKLYCLNGQTGGLKWNYTATGGIGPSAIADLDADGKPEIIVGSADGNINCLNGSGALKWSYPTGPALHASPTPTIADVDGDGKQEVVVGSDLGAVYCLNITGGLKWIYVTGSPILATPIAIDLHGDGQEEVVAGAWNGVVYCINGAIGISLWNYTTGWRIYGAPNAVDIDGDGQREVLVGSLDYKIYCLSSLGGLKWSYGTGHQVQCSPGVADVDQDGQLEIVVGSRDSNIYCLNNSGGLEWSYATGDEIVAYNGPAFADVNGDGKTEVVMGSLDYKVYSVNVKTLGWVPRTSPSGHYVNFTQISTPHGAGYHVDSIGNSIYFYDFMGCTNDTITVARDGTLTVWGWFRQSDSFTAADQPGRRHMLIYVIYADSPEAIAKTVVVLTCDDGTDWKFKNITICGLYPGKLAWIGIGRGDWWQTEFNQVAEWAAVQISQDPVGSSWKATSSPSGHGFNFYTFVTPFGLGYHIDSSGYYDYSYNFYGYTNEVFTVGREGAIQVRGWFRQFDIYSGTYLKEVFVFAVNASNPSVDEKAVVVLDYTDGNSWKYKDVVIGGLAPGSQVRIGIGRHDGWATDWKLTAEWACVEILPEKSQAAPGLRWNLNLGWPSNSSVAVADVDSDGVMEAVVGTIDGSVHCVDTLTFTRNWVYFTHSFSDPKPTIGDVNADNKPEIVVATGAGEIYCLDGSGVAKWYRTLGSAILTAPTLTDIDGDGRKEILVGSIDGHVSCLDGAGALRWSHYIGGSILYSTPCSADFDGDNKIEVVVGSLDHNLYCLNSSGGLEWNCTTVGEIFNPTVASDINNDGKPEVIAATFNGWIYCVNGDGGVVWSHRAAEEITSPLAVGDINRDNVQEMLVMVGPGFCNLTCLTYPDGLKWTSPIGAPADSDPVIAGLSKAGEKEVLLNCGGILNCLSSEGVMEWGLQAAQYMCGSPVVIDVDQDKAGEIMLLGDTTLRYYDYGSPFVTRLQVIVADAQGVAISGASIVCTYSPAGQCAFNGSTTSDGDGHVSFISLISGYYVFLVSCSGYANKTVGTYIVDDTTQRLRVVLSVSSDGGGGSPFDIPVLMVVSAVFLVLLILGVVGFVRRRSDENVTGSRPAYTVSERAAARSVSATEEELITSVRPRPTCPSCGAAIRDIAAEYCQNCGANLGMTLQTTPLRARRARKIVPGSCIVCGLRFQVGNDTVKCPYCGGVAHKIHMLEWLHVKDYCPICQRHLEERDLQRP